MISTGKTTVTFDELESALYKADVYLKRVRDAKAEGKAFDDYLSDLSYYLGIKNTLEMLGLVQQKDFDFLTLE